MNAHIGEIAALAVSALWTITAISFEFAAKRIGPIVLNILRLAVALIIFTVFALIHRGELLPLGAPGSVWLWLGLSGLVGFVIGDLFLFQAFVDIGARTSMVIYASSPLITAILGLFFLGERIALLGVAGMLTVIAGIALVVLDKTPRATAHGEVPLTRRMRGIFCAIGGAVGQSGGLILAKIGAPDFDPFAATQIRVTSGIVAFLVFGAITRKLGEVAKGIRNREAMVSLSIGAFFGPFLGVSLSLFAVQRTNAGIAATLMGLTPILILIPSVFIKKERVSTQEIVGAIAAVAGSALLFSV